MLGYVPDCHILLHITGVPFEAEMFDQLSCLGRALQSEVTVQFNNVVLEKRSRNTERSAKHLCFIEGFNLLIRLSMLIYVYFQ